MAAMGWSESPSANCANHRGFGPTNVTKVQWVGGGLEKTMVDRPQGSAESWGALRGEVCTWKT